MSILVSMSETLGVTVTPGTPPVFNNVAAGDTLTTISDGVLSREAGLYPTRVVFADNTTQAVRPNYVR